MTQWNYIQLEQTNVESAMFLSTPAHVIFNHAAQLSHCTQSSSLILCTPKTNPHSGHSASLSSQLSVDSMFSSEKGCCSSRASTLEHAFCYLIWFASLVAFDLSSFVYLLPFSCALVSSFSSCFSVFFVSLSCLLFSFF